MKCIFIISIILTTLQLAAKDEEYWQNHIVAVDPYGEIINLAKEKLGPNSQRHFFDHIKENVIKSGKTNVVIFIQGGLNDIDDGISRAKNYTPMIMADGSYPIFVAWNARFLSSYWDHVWRIHRGKKSAMAKFLSPFVVIADLGRMIAKSPISSFEQIGSGIRTSSGWRYGLKKPGNNWWCPAENIQEQVQRITEQGMKVGMLPNDPKITFRPKGSLISLLALPKLPTTAVVDTGGQIAWEQMLRRTQTMFDKPVPGLQAFTNGGTKIFARELARYKDDNQTKNLTFTIIGHSMGTIIANQIIADSGNNINIREIVYMAAACQANDFVRIVSNKFLKENTNAVFYNLTLHPANDSGESNTGGMRSLKAVVPYGSLLEWIDYYYSSAESDAGRTLGKWENAIFSTGSIDPEVYSRINIKAFGVGRKEEYGPQKHGSFGGMRFWKKEFWEPSEPWFPSLLIRSNEVASKLNRNDR